MQRNVTSAQRSSAPHARQGDAVKTILITLGIIGLLMVLACAGIGVAGYLFVKKTFENLEVTDPVKIRQATSDMIDITIPAEFKPIVSHAIFGITSVQYDWCPTGSCPPNNESKLMITTLGTSEPGAIQAPDSDIDSELETQFKDFQREDRELNIRGQKVIFVFALGEEHADDRFDELDSANSSDDNSKPKATDPTQPAADPVTTSDAPADTDQDAKPEQHADAQNDNKPDPPSGKPAGEKKKGTKRWLIQGEVPGKKGKCTIVIRLTPEQYNDDLIMTMLKSIR